MSLDKGRISGSLLVYSAACFIIGTSVIIPPARPAGHMAWLVLPLAAALTVPMAWVYATIINRFRGKSIIAVHDLVFGRFLGKLISAVFLLFLFHSGSLVLTNLILYHRSMVLFHTPSAVIAVLIMLPCASAARNGIEVIARASQILLPIVIALLLLTTGLVIPDMDFENFLPFIDVENITPALWGLLGTYSFPFTQIAVFLLVLPALNDGKQATISLSKGIFIAALFLTLGSLRNIAVLGQAQELYNFPSHQAARMINVAGIITRIEILIEFSVLALGFMKIAIFFYGAALGTAKLLKLRTYLPVVLPLAALMTALSLLNVNSIVEFQEFVAIAAPFYLIPFQVGLPVLTLLVAVIRGLPRDKGEPGYSSKKEDKDKTQQGEAGNNAAKGDREGRGKAKEKKDSTKKQEQRQNGGKKQR